MTGKEGKTVTFTIDAPLTAEQEAKEQAIVQAKLAKNEAKAAAAAAELHEQQAGANAELFRRLNSEDFAGLSPTPRRRSREAALLLLFQVEQGGCDWDIAAGVLEMARVKGANAEFALDSAKRAHEQRKETDELLAAYARDWAVERFSPVDLLVLRLAIPELLAEPENSSVVINEAIELGKKFGAEESGAFINGMLDNIRKAQT